MSLTFYGLLTVVLISSAWVYIRQARSLSWFEKANERSAHSDFTTVRSGGFLFPLAAVAAIWFGKLNLTYITLGLLALALVSGWDDFSPVSKRYRLMIQLLAVGLLFFQDGALASQWFVVFGLLMGIGMLNAYNFMDGINGMTALYSLVTVGTFWYWQTQSPGKVNPLFPSVFLSVVVFAYTNVRKRAICFAGDVGSVSMGFIVLYGLLESIRAMHTGLPILCVSVYGVDSTLTIAYRLYRRHPVFLAHRMHLYQSLVHTGGWSHLRVAWLYAAVQAGINSLISVAVDWSATDQIVLATGVLVGLIFVYIWNTNTLNKAGEGTAHSKSQRTE